MKHSAFLLDRGHVPRIHATTGHILLQLTQPLDSSMRSQLHQHGVFLLEYVPENTWKASLPAAALHHVRALHFVHATGDVHPVDKFPIHVLERDFHPHSYEGDGTLNILVTFYRNVSFSRVLDILSDLSGTTDQEGFITGHRVLLSIPRARLQALAEHDEVSWIEDRPTPKQIDNKEAADLSNIDELFVAPYDLDGFGVRIGEWDAAEVQEDHPDLAGRIFVIEPSSVSLHATHVAGTILGSGLGDPNAKGMAPAATLYSYDWEDDFLSEMSSAVSTHGIQISSNSWGYSTGWHPNLYGDGMDVWMGDDGFGQYSSESAAWDQTAIDTGLIIVKSAGNDRTEDGDQLQSGHYHYDDPNTVYYDYHPPDGDYDCIGRIGTSKNLLTIGGVNDWGNMTLYSSWGPADDGRIKPDVVTNGTSLISTCPTSDYCTKTGTSMATAVAGGAIALIIQRYEDVFGVAPSAATVKALAINTATDLGNAGPDYSYGWGLLDARAAVDMIDADQDHVREQAISNGETLEYVLQATPRTAKLQVTIAWTDLAGSPGAAPALVNDIDVELVHSYAGAHLPWVLDPNTPAAEASTGINSVDNAEQVFVDSPPAGIWTIRVTGANVQGSQTFTMVTNLPLNFDPIPVIPRWAIITLVVLSISVVISRAVRAG